MSMELKRFRLTFGDKLFTVFTIAISTGAFQALFMGSSSIPSDPDQGNRLLQIVWSIIYGISFWRLIFSAKRRHIPLFGNSFVWPLMILALGSVSWSFFPLLTLQRVIALLGTYTFALYLIKFYEWPELLRILTFTFGFIEIMSLIFVIALPDYGLDPFFEGAWRGVFLQKNGLGGSMVLAALFWIFKIKKHPSVTSGGLLALSILLIIFSTSKTALVIFLMIVIFAILPMKKILEPNYRNITIAIALVLMVGFASAFLVAHYTFALGLFGRDATLTGRTVLWRYTWDMIQVRPWTGYGYGAFWVGWDGPSSYIWQFAGWEPTHSHNGLLEVCLQLGIIGVVIISLSFFVNLVKSIKISQRQFEFGHVGLVLLIFILIYNVDESKLLVRNSYIWILYVYVSIELNILDRQARNFGAQ